MATIQVTPSAPHPQHARTGIHKDGPQRPKVVVIGGGFGGLQFAKNFEHSEWDAIVVDRHNYHTFQPLLYQVATGGLEADSIAYPLRKVFRKSNNIFVRWAEVTYIDTQHKILRTTLTDISYDRLVIATGSTGKYFNFERVKDKLLTMKTVPDALNLRSYVLQNFEKAVTETNIDYFDELINVAIVGGGATGLELAGAIGEMKKFVLPNDYPEIDVARMNIVLFQAGDRLLNNMSEHASRKALEFVQELGVTVRLNERVSDYDGDILRTESGFEMRTDTVIWTAGVKATYPEGLPEEATKTGRIAVDEFNRVKGLEDVYAIGDVAEQVSPEHPRGLPMLAPVAQQQGEHLAKNLLRLKNGEAMKPFVYKDKGTMATVGRNRAVVDLPNYKFAGFFAWITWMFVHVMLLVGFRNKFAAIVDWSINYLTYDSPMRLIIRPFRAEGVGSTPPQPGSMTPMQTEGPKETIEQFAGKG